MIALGSTSYLTQANRPTYAFIDADNIRLGLQQLLKRHDISCSVEEYFDLEKVIKRVEADRFFLYSAVELTKDAPDWIAGLRSSPKVVFRSGVLVQHDSGRRKQEGVDVLLALDALGHAHKRNMKTCVIMSADGDLLPLVNALVAEGIETIVCNFDNPEAGDVASRMRDAADDFWQYGSHFLRSCFVETHRCVSTNRIPSHEFGSTDFSIPIFKEWGNQYSVTHLTSRENAIEQDMFCTKSAAEFWAKLHM